MKTKYVIYICSRNSCDVEFSNPYNSYNLAKNSIDEFLSSYVEKRNKKSKFVSKEEFEKIKVLKRPEDCFYIRKKNSEAVVYSVIISSGTFFNSYSIEKYGKVGIAEFLITKEGEDKKNEKDIKNEEVRIKDMHVTNYERGAHVSFVTELKSVLSKRETKEIPKIEEKIIPIVNKSHNSFIEALIEGKSKLRSPTCPS